MEQYFQDLINDNYEHIGNVLLKYGFNVEPTTEILLRAYELFGDEFLKEIYFENSNFSGNKPSLNDWITTMNLSVSSKGGKKQGTDEQKDWGLTDNAKEEIDNETEEKKSFWEKTKNLWDKALPLVNTSTDVLNALDKEVVNPQSDNENNKPPDITNNSKKNNIIWFVIGGILIVGISVTLYFVFRNK